MPTTMLDQATAMIENAWGQPIEALEVLGVRRPSDDPLLRCAMHTRTALAITDNAVTVHQDRLHALSRHGYVPDFYELDRITETAGSLRVAHAERSSVSTPPPRALPGSLPPWSPTPRADR